MGGEHAPGDTIADRYRVVGVLGRGGAGVTYEAEELSIGGRVAVGAEDAPMDHVSPEPKYPCAWTALAMAAGRVVFNSPLAVPTIFAP